jgi:hypothetical protein
MDKRLIFDDERSVLSFYPFSNAGERLSAGRSEPTV